MSLIWPIIKQCIAHAKRVAITDDRGDYTYGKLLGGAMHLAEHIEQITANRHIGIMLPTSGAFPIALLGAWLAKRVAVPMNYLLSPDELAYVIGDSGVDTIISTKLMMDHLTEAHGQGFIPPGVKVQLIEDIDFTGALPLRWPPRPRKTDLAAILYTSGTSGRPKGVMLSHGNLQSNVQAAIVHSELTEANTFLGVLPQFHSFGLTVLTLLPLSIGAKVVFSAQFLPRRIVKLVHQHKADVFLAVPSMYGALLSVKKATAEDLESIRIAVSAGEPLPNATFEAYRDRFNIRLLEGYGLTETSPCSHWSTPTRNKLHSVGTPLPGVTQLVVDADDKPVPVGEEGEILLAGPNVMQGYYHLPEQTAEVFVDLPLDGNKGGPKDGHDGEMTRFFRTGDIGKIDEDGFLYITGRKKEMLIVGGENVFPREIEEVLNKHESVKDSAVIGKNDGMRGEVPIAFIELDIDDTSTKADTGASSTPAPAPAEDFDDKPLRAWCRDNLAGYKVPREIVVVDELPRNPTGKIMRRKLKDRPEVTGE